MSADEVLAQQAWDLYCRGGDVVGIAQALHVEPRQVAEWFAGREPTPEDRRSARHLDNLRAQQRQLHAAEPSAAPNARASILAQIGRVERQIEAAEGARAQFRPAGSARGDWHDIAAPIWKDLDAIKRATKTRGLAQCRYVDRVALRAVNARSGDLYGVVQWLRDLAVRECPGCPVMRFRRRCTSCGRLTNGDACPLHGADAALEDLPQPFKWCLTVGHPEIERAMREQRHDLPERFRAPAPGYSALAADRGYDQEWESYLEQKLLYTSVKRDLQRHEAAIADGSRDTAEWRRETRDIRDQADRLLVHITEYEESVAGRRRPMVQFNQQNNLAVGAETVDRFMAAVRADPRRIAEARDAAATLVAIQEGKRPEPQEVIDVVAGPGEEHRADREGGAARRPRARGGKRPAEGAAGRVAKGPRRAGRAPGAASA